MERSWLIWKPSDFHVHYSTYTCQGKATYCYIAYIYSILYVNVAFHVHLLTDSLERLHHITRNLSFYKMHTSTIYQKIMLDQGMAVLARRGPSLARSIPSFRRSYSSQNPIARKPLSLSGAIKAYKHVELTPVVGTEFLEGSLAEMVSAPNSDELIRDLAITSEYPKD